MNVNKEKLKHDVFAVKPLNRLNDGPNDPANR